MDQNTVGRDERTHFTFDINQLSGFLLFSQQYISENHIASLTPLSPGEAAHGKNIYNFSFFSISLSQERPCSELRHPTKSR